MSGLKIVHFLWSMDLRDGGVVRALLDLCPALARAGHEVTMLACRGEKDMPAAWATPEGERFASGGCVRARTIPLPGALNRLGPAALEAAATVLREYDVVHLHGMWLYSTGQIADLARRLGKAYVWSPHGMLDEWCMAQSSAKKRVFLAVRERSRLRRAAFVHFTARAEMEQAWSRIGDAPQGARARVIPLVFDLRPFDALPGPATAQVANAQILTNDCGTTRPVILFLSRLHPKKGAELVLEAARVLVDQGLDPAVVIAGTGDEEYARRLKSRASELKLNDRTVFPGFVSGAPKLSLYQAARVFCLPSSQENFGFVVVESLMCETPVVTTKGVAIWPELAESGGGAIVKGEAHALADALAPWLLDESSARAAGQRGRAYVRTWLDEQRIVGEFSKMYAEAAKTRAGASAAMSGGPSA